MSTPSRTIRNLWRIGFKQFGHQLQYMGDTKAGTLIGVDRCNNKYYENLKELPLRTRWVDFKNKDCQADHIEPGWHAWLSYMVDKPPTEDPIMLPGQRVWEQPYPVLNYTATRAAYRPYSTTKTKCNAWEPKALPR